ncbi:hypothetical protein [uncultured phage MedDCM-OCT-S09-C28]|nr:hypothetical protein [uncultured phage MedDCM-OCT-S09-C28]
MTVFLGDQGKIQLKRLGGDRPFVTRVNRSDVREDIDRFSVDFAHEQFITGDRIEITTLDGQDLTWIDDPNADDSFTRFAHVDQAGGIRLYDSFSDAIAGLPAGAIQLTRPSESQEVSITVQGSDEYRCLADVTKYEITTSRETIDSTHLGAQFRKQYESGLIQGQGRIECFWRHYADLCEEDEQCCDEDLEFSAYLARLCIRLVHGGAFKGQFFVYADENNRRRSVWYESDACVITNVAITVEPTELVRTTIDFVTSGPISLREGYLPSFLELEQSEFDVKLEQSPGGNIELENPG